jgi:hypothetical protein
VRLLTYNILVVDFLLFIKRITIIAEIAISITHKIGLNLIHAAAIISNHNDNHSTKETIPVQNPMIELRIGNIAHNVTTKLNNRLNQIIISNTQPILKIRVKILFDPIAFSNISCIVSILLLNIAIVSHTFV